MIERKYDQRQLGEGFIRDSIDDCWEPWMKIADEILDDEELIDPVYEALRRRRPKSATRGRKGTPAEVALRMLALKHMRNWSFDTLGNAKSAPIWSIASSREWGPKRFRMPRHSHGIECALGPEVFQKVHGRMVGIAREKKAVEGRKMRVDTHSDGNQHSLSDRQQSLKRWCTGADSDDEADCRDWRRSWRAGARSNEECGPPSDGVRPRRDSSI